MPNGSFLRETSSTFLNCTKIYCAVSGRRYAIDAGSADAATINLARLENEPTPLAQADDLLHSLRVLFAGHDRTYLTADDADETDFCRHFVAEIGDPGSSDWEGRLPSRPSKQRTNFGDLEVAASSQQSRLSLLRL